MQEFINNTKGAVTVFVTLLLIPAMLISGTAVDLARIHTARSIIQDANQLAANSILSQYNALLKDLYGLFGVAEDDPVLGQLLDDYIKVSVFGESGQDRSLGTLQLFYGSNISLAEVLFADEKHLRNEDVLRRQIEEYMKFRGPVIIVQDMLELLGSSTFKEDTGVIGDKLEIEKAIAEMYEMYKELYDAIVFADKCDQIGGIVGGTVGTVSSSLDRMREEFISLKYCYEAWENATGAEKAEYERRYTDILENIRVRTVGGNAKINWVNGRWLGTSYSQGLNKTIENAKDHAENFKPNFDKVINIAKQIDSMSIELSRKINAFESRLTTGSCNDELKTALTEKTGTPAKSILDRYKDILKWDNLEDMAVSFQINGYSYIDDVMKPLLESVRYRNMHSTWSTSLTRIQLENIVSNPGFRLSENILAANSPATILGSYTKANVTYNVPPGFKKFAGCDDNNKLFFDELSLMMNQPKIPPVRLYDDQKEASGLNAESKQRGMITDLMGLVSAAYAGLKNEPLGAKYINGKNAPVSEKLDLKDIEDLISQAANEPASNVISNLTSSVIGAADYLLLLSYCTSVFSNYTTARPDSTGKSKSDLGSINFPKTITGTLLSPEVNYFFQSEWEYLYTGDENASKNLNAIKRLIFIVRLICNYITVFSVSEITAVITSIRTAFIWNPPLGLILGELARAAFVAAESAVDVATLRAGYKVPLIKSGKSGEWVCSPGGISKALADITTDNINAGKNTGDKGLTYSNYMVFFFIAKALTGSKAESELTQRTANLIEWNVINYKHGIFSDEGKMAGALSDGNRFKLLDMKTDFSLTTTVDLRMLFLSMLFAQNFSDSRGIGMPSAMPVIVTDHRGY